jgi:hypothetical protein
MADSLREGDKHELTALLVASFIGAIAELAKVAETAGEALPAKARLLCW